MLNWIQGQTACPARSLIPEPQSHIAVGQLVQRQREEQGWQAGRDSSDDTGYVHKSRAPMLVKQASTRRLSVSIEANFQKLKPPMHTDTLRSQHKSVSICVYLSFI